jgi:hypothetical protein
MAKNATIRRAVWFYNLELASLVDGGYHVHLSATTVNEDEPELLCQEILYERFASIDDAFAAVKKSVTELI